MKLIFSTALIFITLFSNAQKTIKVYHGVTGASEIFEQAGIGTSKTIKAKKGEQIKIQIINPQPALYDYSFKTETIKEEEDKIDGSSNLISLISTLLAQEPSAEARKGTNAKGARVPAVAATATWQDAYLNKIEKLSDEIKLAQTIIKRSDNPESLRDVIDKIYNNNGFQWAKNELKKIPFFTNSNLEDEVKKWAVEYKSATYLFDSSKPLEVLTMDIYDNYAQSLLKLAKAIQSAYKVDVSTTITYTITVGDSIQSVNLSIKSKSDALNGREVGDKIINVTIQPRYNRAVLEFVPVGAFIYTKEALKYSIINDVIVEEKDEGFRFRAGGILNMNFYTWGPLNQYSMGLGAGFAISENELNTFYGSFLISYKKWVRFGIGYGAFSVPSYLKDGGKVGSPLPSTVSDLNSVIGYSKKQAIFFTFVIPGLNLPILK